MIRYVVYIHSDKIRDRLSNQYGYYTGKSYIVNFERFPIHTGNEITLKTKRFKSRKTAINCAEKCYEKFGYVVDYDIEEVWVEE